MTSYPNCNICSQKNNLQQLNCGHIVCRNCLPISYYSSSFPIICQQCDEMTIISNHGCENQANPENLILCLDCNSNLMTARNFLQSTHRQHNVVPAISIIEQVQKGLRKYEISLQLQSKGLYHEVELLTKQKRKIGEKYSKKCQEVHSLFDQLIQKIRIWKIQCLSKYEKIVLEEIKKFDIRIQQHKKQIKKCQSFISSIQHFLGGDNEMTCLSSTQFFFRNKIPLDQEIGRLIQERKNRIIFEQKQDEILAPATKVLIDLIQQIKGIKPKIWIQGQGEQFMQLKFSNSSLSYSNYFQNKRKEILGCQNMQNLQTSQLSKQFKQVQVEDKSNSIANSTNYQPYNYNIQSRIENLRKTLKLGSPKQFESQKSSSLRFSFTIK